MLARMVVVLVGVVACYAEAPAGVGLASVTVVNSHTLDIEYNDVPDETAAKTATNYSIPGLTVYTASSTDDGTVRLTTTGQTEISYTLTVANVTRASDAHPIERATKTFAGRSTFNLVSAAAVDGSTFT